MEAPNSNKINNLMIIMLVTAVEISNLTRLITCFLLTYLDFCCNNEGAIFKDLMCSLYNVHTTDANRHVTSTCLSSALITFKIIHQTEILHTILLAKFHFGPHLSSIIRIADQTFSCVLHRAYHPTMVKVQAT
jgi:hypothetical protein